METEKPVIRLFASDLDGTLIGNPESTRRFKDAWESLPEKQRPLLCYASGRLVPNVLTQIESSGLPMPEWIIGGVGTQIYDVEKQAFLKDFTRLFKKGWNPARIDEIVGAFPGAAKQPAELLHEYKSSWYLHRAHNSDIRELTRRLRAAGLLVTVVYSSLRDLDILPRRANKGNALEWLCKRLRIPLDQLLVAGDTGNDSSMFLLPGVHGIVVENAQPELYEAVVHLPVCCTSSVLADGVLEGLKHFGIIAEVPTADQIPAKPVERHPTMSRVLALTGIGPLTTEQRDFIETGYARAQAALKKNITPLGFTACSAADNEIIGTDANYRRVWARDGSIAVISSLDLEDPDIRRAQERTLRTLLDRLSPAGQIPTNVSVEDGMPDYSGVGGICSIDSGLWVIIAFHNYLRKTQDNSFLAEYAERLHRVMNWLSAHDSNNDGLLEIPEAGDWSDLFSRSYNVLYDEVLWFQANVSFGRLLEHKEDLEGASQYLHRSQFIRSSLLESFWPSTMPEPETKGARTFADQQYSLGDTRYLLSEITPFNFNWRCDVLGNILAFLFNVLDADRARIAFTFLWGVGVNDPWPVANLYPPVQSGDPDWKPYYVVNLLNLPYHYHNGGIWPFIGGLWVRFVHRLGLHDLAAQELFRLAQLNKAGKYYEWEFNEWAHGRTGRPMGKCFQAWSAATYIHACHELEICPVESLSGVQA